LLADLKRKKSSDRTLWLNLEGACEFNLKI